MFPSTKAHKYYGILLLAHGISPILYAHGYLDDPLTIYSHFPDHLPTGHRFTNCVCDEVTRTDVPLLYSGCMYWINTATCTGLQSVNLANTTHQILLPLTLCSESLPVRTPSEVMQMFSSASLKFLSVHLRMQYSWITAVRNAFATEVLGGFAAFVSRLRFVLKSFQYLTQ